ncbi:unnamed protein product [Dicrocoelium dendriticum]|nr:unnamed protein product [Dicrocoelium dendriticum]
MKPLLIPLRTLIDGSRSSEEERPWLETYRHLEPQRTDLAKMFWNETHRRKGNQKRPGMLR